MEPILSDGVWQPAKHPSGTFQATNPVNRQPLPHQYPVSTWEDLDAMLGAAQAAVVEMRTIPPEKTALFLNTFADALSAQQATLVEAAGAETALPTQTRLPGELNRTTNQLKQAADAVRERTWVRATIDTENNIRSMFGPLNGPVAVFGPNNFPLAFNGVSGGDFAAAIAAGNPVIAKANPGHPRTTQLLAAAAHQAAQATGMPRALVQMFYHTQDENGLRLVSDPRIGATAFTGSKAGLHLKRAADEAGKPIYLEMSSVNPLVILPGALEERAEAIADALFGSCTLGVGQFCTNPGLVFLVEGTGTEAFIGSLMTKFEAAEPGVLLTENSPDVLARGVAAWREAGARTLTGGEAATGEAIRFQNTLMRATGDQFLAHADAMQTEAFGVASLLVVVNGIEQLVACLQALEGNLTGSIYSATTEADDEDYNILAPILRARVGRLLNDKMPTGVAVVPAMQHGGPYPATGHPGFTAVGIPAAIHRFAALYGYDNVRPSRLPAELQDKAPVPSMWRYVDGRWMQGDIKNESS